MHCAQRAVVFGGGINKTIAGNALRSKGSGVWGRNKSNDCVPSAFISYPPPQKKKKTRHNQVDPDVEAAYCFRWVAFLHV